MPKIKMNLSEVDNGFDPIPEGTYNAYVHTVKFKTFKSGNTGYSIRYNIAEGKYKGRVIFDNIVLTQAAYFKVAQFYKAVTGKSSGNVEIDTDKFKDYQGTLVKLKVGIDEERDQNTVKNVSYAGGAQHKSDTDDLNAMIENRSPVAVGAPDDDDFPF
jgi:hypothetical protein